MFLLSFYPAQKEHVVFGSCRDHAGRIWAGPMLIHVRLLDAMLRAYPSQIELLFSQERRVPLKPLRSPEGTRCFWLMSGPCWACIEPMFGPVLIHVRLLEALLGPYSSHACWSYVKPRTACSFLSLYAAQKEHVVFGTCRDHVGRI